jgi:hypothetical protein
VPEFGRAVVVSCPVVDGLLGLLMFGLLEVVELFGLLEVVELFGLLEVLELFGLFMFELLLLSLIPVLLLWPAVAFESVGLGLLGLLGLIEELGVVVLVLGLVVVDPELIELLSVRFIPLVAEPLLAELSATGPRMEVSRPIPLFIRFMLVSEPIAAPALPVR